jgi:hypothetical protein
MKNQVIVIERNQFDGETFDCFFHLKKTILFKNKKQTDASTLAYKYSIGKRHSPSCFENY